MVLPQKWQVVEQNDQIHIWFNKLYLKYEKKNLFHFCIKIRRNLFPNPIYRKVYILEKNVLDNTPKVQNDI